jgi:hypothetical protein
MKADALNRLPGVVVGGSRGTPFVLMWALLHVWLGTLGKQHWGPVLDVSDGMDKENRSDLIYSTSEEVSPKLLVLVELCWPQKSLQ